jgi:ligand-binding sensor domain-containing protein
MLATPTAVYAGTLDRGLAIYNRAAQRWNFWTSGLPSRNVTALEARSGILYIGTDNGLIKVPESTLVAR